MPYRLQCADCFHRYSRSYLALSHKCPRCKSGDVLIISPSRQAGRVILIIGLVLFLLLVADLCLLTGGGPGNTFLGMVIVLFFGGRLLIYYGLTLLIALLVALIIITGFNIAFGKHPAGE